MIALTAVDLKFLARELKKEVEKSIVEKIFHPAEKEIILVLHSAGEGKKLLKIVAGSSLYITKEKKEMETPTVFCMTLRKNLKQARIISIEQRECERIVEISCSNNQKLIIELFSKGNIILVDQEGKIIALLERQEWKHRTLERGKAYVYPPATSNPFTLTEEEFHEKYEASEKDNGAKILATDFALGGKYAEEIFALAKLDKKKKKQDTIKLWKTIKSLESKPLRPVLIDKGVKIEFTPIELASEENAKKQYFNTISEALEFAEKTYGEEKQQHQEELEKLRELAQMQKDHVEELKREAEEFKKIGDLLYVRYADVDSIIKDIKEKKWNISHPLIKEMKKAEGKVIIEL